MSGSGGPQERPGLGPHDPVPDDVLERARQAFGQRAEGPIAKLISDSLVDEGDKPESHVLLFETQDVKVEVHVESSRSQSRLRGTVSGMSAERASLHLEGSDLALASDVKSGAFTFDPVGHGVVRMSFEAPEASTLMTDWFQI